MNTDIQKKIAYDLTMEYIRENNVLKCREIDISEKVQNINEYYHTFLQEIKEQNALQ